MSSDQSYYPCEACGDRPATRAFLAGLLCDQCADDLRAWQNRKREQETSDAS